MSEKVEVPIITADAVTNLAELRKAIKEAKTDLDGLELGSAEYQEQLAELIKLQNLLRGAMNGTTASMDDLTAAADGTAQTYNGLVNKMADMKRELRNIDVSTEEGAAAFKKLAGEINAVNDQLKEMDAMKGDFQRNVGNYKSALDGVGGVLVQMPPTLGKAKKELGDLGQTMQLVGKQPILGIIGLLAPLISQIASGLKDNKTAMDAIKKGMDALKPVTDFFAGVLESIAGLLADVIDKAVAFVSGNGVFQKVIQGVMGVGNAILQYVVAPFKGVIAAIKVFKEQGIKGIGDAARAFGSEMKNGFAFKQNFNAGQAAGDAILQGMASRKADAKKTGEKLGAEVAKGVKEKIDLEKIWAEAMRKYEARKRDKDALTAEMDAVLAEQQALIDAEVEQYIAALEDEARAEQIVRDEQVKMAKEAAEKKAATMAAYADAVSGILTAVADAMESGTDVTEAEERKAKNLRIAAATIDMLQGAVTAFSTAQQLGPIAGPIVGAINAAAVVATGLANISKIRSTNVSKDASPTASAPAQVQAPAVQTAVPTTTVVNGARTETALNRAANARVVLVQSDVEAAAATSRVQVEESSF